MVATMRPEEWLGFLTRAYLDEFVPEGGAAIKFAVPLERGLRRPLHDGLMRRSVERGYAAASVSSAETRIHLMDQVFFRVAQQIDWRAVSREVISKLAAQAGYAPPSPGSDALSRRLAAANGVDAELVMLEARKWISKEVFAHPSLTKDFRVAMTHLCLAELAEGPDAESTVEVITDWLTGRNRGVSAVKPYEIYTRIHRNNARRLFESLLVWLRLAGRPGLLVILDIVRVTILKNPHDERLWYSKAAMLDAFELLRQFIDATDRLAGCLLVVVPGLPFLDVEPYGRGMGAYDALKLRIYDEVHDQRLVNPLAALVRLSAGEVAE